MIHIASLLEDAFFNKSYIVGTHERQHHYRNLHHDDKRQLYATMRFVLVFWLSLQKNFPKLAKKEHLKRAHCCSFVALEKILSKNAPIYHVSAELKSALTQLKALWCLPLYLAWFKKWTSFEEIFSDVISMAPIDLILSENPDLLCAHLFGHPPLGLRVHDLSALSELDPLNIIAQIDNRTVVVKKNNDDIRSLFSCGKISYQNPAAQQISKIISLLEPWDSATEKHLLDACAAPGAKSFILMELLQERPGSLLCCDLEHRIEALEQNISRSIIAKNTTIQTCGHDWQLEPLKNRLFDIIMLDGPCSGSGVSRKHPDALWRLNNNEIVEHHHKLCSILKNVWTCLKPGGLLIYATCSLLHAENSAVIENLCSEYDIEILEFKLEIGAKKGLGWQIFPTEHYDGLFYAALRKKY
jgi:16S rRNA C967 or C1407 C5-methylase (RsmB/RsmF family)